MPNTGPSCLPSSVKVLRRLMLVSRVSSHTERSRPQNIPGLWSGLSLSTRGAEAKGGPDFNISNLPSSTKSGVRLSFPWKTMEGLLSLTKQRRKHLQKTNLEGLQSCLLKTPRAQDISESRVCICLEVQGISEVCLNTNRILGQHPVRGMVHRLRELETD